MESLAQLEALCERLYNSQDSMERAHAENTLKCFSVNTEYISQCQYILDHALTPYALMLASSSLLKQVTEHTLALQLRLDIRNSWIHCSVFSLVIRGEFWHFWCLCCFKGTTLLITWPPEDPSYSLLWLRRWYCSCAGLQNSGGLMMTGFGMWWRRQWTFSARLRHAFLVVRNVKFLTLMRLLQLCIPCSCSSRVRVCYCEFGVVYLQLKNVKSWLGCWTENF